MTDKPKLPLTVPLALWEKLAGATTPAFADSYLSGATVSGDTLTTKTRIAGDRLMGSIPAAHALQLMGIKVVQPPVQSRAWSWPTDDELAAMPLREKIRQFRIMASQARGKAGPMRDDGTHARPDWLDKARAYEDEGKRLETFLERA